MKRTAMILGLLALFILGFWLKLYRLSPLEQPERQILIHVEGEVVHPGLYRLKEDQRLGDLIELAGGLTPKADRVNLAKKLIDGEKIIIARMREEVVGNAEEKGPSMHHMNIADWMQVPGVGEVTAQAILDYLKAHPEAGLEDLLEVRGIGEKKLEVIRQYLGNP